MRDNLELHFLEREIKTCDKCRLHRHRKHALPGLFPENALPLLFVGTAPSKWDDDLGETLCGVDATYFENLLFDAGYDKPVNYTYCIKCIPYYRKGKLSRPKRDSIFWCAEYLFRQIKALDIKIVCAMGYEAFTMLVRRFDMNFYTPRRISMEKVVDKLYKTTDLDNNRIYVYATRPPTFAKIRPKQYNNIVKQYNKVRLLYNDFLNGKSLEDLSETYREIPEDPSRVRKSLRIPPE